MIAPAPERRRRAPFQGARQILRLNWPWYALAFGLCLVGGGLLGLAPLPPGVALGLAVGAGAAGAWGVASLIAAHWIYDRSEIYDLAWLPDLLPRPPARWVNIHAGLDETSPALCAFFPAAESQVLDIHDPATMSEPAIARARRLGTPDPAATPADPRRLPLPDASADVIMLVFAAHEIRHPEVRLALFRELRRALQPGGRIVLVEHLRDLANFLVFGPGFWHFLPEREWVRLGRESRLVLHRSFPVTPFVRVFVLGAD